MKLLVIGATGKVGAELIPRLVAEGGDVRALVRSAERAALLPPGVDVVVGDVAQVAEECSSAFAGIDAVFMLNQPTFQEVAEGLFAVELAREAGVRRFVYQSVHRAEDLSYLPHVASKLAIERVLAQSGMACTVLRPNHFFQNDAMTRSGLERGVYGVPIGMVGCSGVDVRDIAETAAIVLSQVGHVGERYNIVGPAILTGEGCAAQWTRTLGRTVRYVGDVNEWREKTRPFMPSWLNYDLGLMYGDFARRGFIAEQTDVDRLTLLLGRSPWRYEDYVREQAGAWGMSRSPIP